MGEFAEDVLGRLGELDGPAAEVVEEEPAPTAEQEDVEDEVEDSDSEETLAEDETEEEEEADEAKVPVAALKDERRKRQELEARLQALEEGQQQPKTQKQQTLEEAYNADPKGVLNALTERIAAAEVEGNVAEAERLRDLKDDLKLSGVKRLEQQYQQQSQLQKLSSMLLEAIPDYQKKQSELTEFAIDTLGYTMNDLARSTDPHTRGVDGIKEIIRINTAYEAFMANRTVPKKKVKKATKVEKPSTGTPPAPNNLSKAHKDAKESGNWQGYLEELFDD